MDSVLSVTMAYRPPFAFVATHSTSIGSFNRGKGKLDAAAQGSIASIIVHDVQRTKIGHHVFASGGQGMAMLKRVLIRCADLGAVKEAGYIQVGGQGT